MIRNIVFATFAAGLAALAYWFFISEDSGPAMTGSVTPDPITRKAVETDAAPRVSGVHLDALDRETPPQQDFYAFANGGWLDATEIPEIYSGYTVYHEVYEDAEETLRDIIESAAADTSATGERAKIGAFYSSWMDEETINARGVEPIQPEMDIISGIADRNSLVAALPQLSRMGVEIPFSHGVGIDDRNSSQYAFFISQDGLTLPNRDYYLDDENPRFAKVRDALPLYIEDMLVLAGVERSHAAQQASAVYELEKAIAKVQWSAVENRDPEKRYNPYTRAELAQLGNTTDWNVVLEHLGVGELDRVIIGQPSYFAGMDKLLAEVPLETWRAYLAFHAIDGWGKHLSEEVAARRFDFRGRVLSGQKEQPPRWKSGISLTNSVLGEAVGKVYVEREFPPAAKAKMEELVGNVIATFREDIGKLEWMSETTRAKAREKLSKFTAKIGYPDEWKDYSKLEIVEGDHVGNLRRAAAWNYQEDLDKLGGPVDRNEWFMTPQTVNAYYAPSRNEIVFPAARLQPPFFQLNADDAINYGAVGGVIGHEISHGFDDKGSQYDGDGNLVNWWTEEDRAAFDARTAKLVEQFSNYEPIEGMHINGELTLGENIGDLSGVTMAYRAYIRSLNGEEPPVIDGFTGPQRFFIGYAMSRKGKYTEESLAGRLASDPHSPLKYRVNGIYRNIDAFHEAFGTNPGDGMWLPPEERVRLW